MQLKFLCSLIVLAIAPPAALAQTASPASNGTAAPSPSSMAYQSAFADYKPYKESVVMSWRAANDQVRDAGGMQGHDMATMKSQTDDPHAGHAMSSMGTKPGAGIAAGSGLAPAAKRAVQDHASHGAPKAQADDPHAGHGMSKMSPARPDAAARPKAGARSASKRTDPAPNAKQVPAPDPHAGHDMSKTNNKKEGE